MFCGKALEPKQLHKRLTQRPVRIRNEHTFSVCSCPPLFPTPHPVLRSAQFVCTMVYIALDWSRRVALHLTEILSQNPGRNGQRPCPVLLRPSDDIVPSAPCGTAMQHYPVERSRRPDENKLSSPARAPQEVVGVFLH